MFLWVFYSVKDSQSGERIPFIAGKPHEPLDSMSHKVVLSSGLLVLNTSELNIMLFLIDMEWEGGQDHLEKLP